MAVAEASRTQARLLPGGSRLALLGYAGLAAVVGWWTWRAFHDPSSADTGLAYLAGQVAWATGHPEHLASWVSTPFLGAVMALLSRVVSMRTAADLVTVLNVAVWVGAVAVVLHRTRRLLSPVWWWIAAFGLISFGPMMSSVWWKQFNVIALVSALAGFELVRRRRVTSGAAAIGLSIALKPIAILLPFVMLARRETRRAGALASAWIVGLSVAAQGFMAVRARDLATLDPLISERNFLDKTKPNAALCHPLNFSPTSFLCREIGGFQHWTLQRIAVGCALLLLGAWVVSALRGRAPMSWEVFAFTCALSAMVGPLEWTHYQIMLAPLFVLLLFRFAREGAGLSIWAGLAVAFALASLIWQPYGTLLGSLRDLIAGVRESHNVLNETPGQLFQLGLAQFAQYVLIMTGVLWYLTQQHLGDRSSGVGPPTRNRS